VRPATPRIPLLALTAALAAFAAACGDETVATGGPDVDGAWQGSAVLGADTFDFQLELDESDDDVEGTGRVEGDAETVDLAVEGEAVFPAFDLALTSPGYTPLRLAGTYQRGAVAANDSLVGSLTGSGFAGTRLVLRRRP
jgi:hypothetical protein